MVCAGRSVSLRIVPASRADVSAFVARVHRHHKPSVGDVFRLACVDGDGLVRGVASIGRPVAKRLDDGWTLEITRVATDGADNACSLLYGASRRVAFAMGYRRILTYTLPEEGGASLRASGWTCEGEQKATTGKGWKSRGDERSQHKGGKVRWTCENSQAFTGDVDWPGEVASPQAALFGKQSRRVELIQVAAVCVQIIEAIDAGRTR